MAISDEHKTGRSHTEHAEPNYIGVFIVLLVLTVIEVGVTYTPLPKVGIVLLLLSFAFVKAALVALYFMHLKFDPRLLATIFVVPLLLGSVLIFFVAL